MTFTTSVAVARAVVAAKEVQVTSAVGVRRTERTRPVVAALTHVIHVISKRTAATASSREEDTVAVGFTGYEITVVSTLGCPSPIAFITEFFKLSYGRHAPHTAPVLTGGVMTTGRADARLASNLVGAPTVACAVKAVKAVVPSVT